MNTVFLWRMSLSFNLATSDAERTPSSRDGGAKLQDYCTYLRLGFVASAISLTFVLQILILLVAMGKKLPILRFCVAILEYDRNNK